MVCIPDGFEWGSDAAYPEKSERRNMRLRRSSDRVINQARAFVASLELIGDGVILLDEDGHILFASENAHSILGGYESYIRIAGDRLQFADSGNERHLKALLAPGGGFSKSSSHCSVMTIERATSNHPLVLSLFPLPPAAPEEEHAPRMMVIFRDPDNIPTPQWQIFARHFQLSATEIRLCLAMAEGLTVAEYSEKYHISLHTARSHLKSVFAKTSTRRQADLLRLIFTFTRL